MATETVQWSIAKKEANLSSISQSNSSLRQTAKWKQQSSQLLEEEMSRKRLALNVFKNIPMQLQVSWSVELTDNWN